MDDPARAIDRPLALAGDGESSWRPWSGEAGTAISTRLLRDRPVVDAVLSFAQAGFGALEVCALPGHFDPSEAGSATKLAAECRARSVGVLSLHAPYVAPLDLTQVPRGERQRAVREVGAAADALAALGGRYLVIHAGSEVAPGALLQPRWEALVESLERVHRRCRSLGIELLVEEMEPRTFGGRDEDLDRLAALRPRPFDGFCLDVVHSHLAGALEDRLRRFSSEIRLVHAADTWSGSPAHEHLLPGQGDVPWNELQELLSARPDVPVVLEVDGMGLPDREMLRLARSSLAHVSRTAVVG